MNELIEIVGIASWYFLMFYITLAETFLCGDWDWKESMVVPTLLAVFWPIYYCKIILEGWYGYITNPKSFLE